MLSFYRDAMEPFHCFQHGFSFTSCYCLSERSNSQRTQKSVGAFLGVLMRVVGILGIRVLARICQVLASSSVPDTVVYAYNSSNWQRLGPGSEVQGHRKLEVSLLHSHLEKKKKVLVRNVAQESHPCSVWGSRRSPSAVSSDGARQEELGVCTSCSQFSIPIRDGLKSLLFN